MAISVLNLKMEGEVRCGNVLYMIPGRVFVALIRWTLLLTSIVFIFLCRYMPSIAEWYAQTVYPPLSYGLSVFSSLFPFPLEEILVIGLVLWLILYPIWKRSKGIHWKKILFREAEMLAGIYVWFYLG